MKKKFISVAMFLALAVSSPVWVGCANYDDDIANLQSQVDGLKSSVEVSKSEALQALEQAQAALQADIDELTAGKADEQAVKDLQATVADLQTALDNNDITAAGELAQKVNDLVEQVNAIPTELEGVRDDLNAQKEELQGNIDALQGELNTLKEQMANAATEEDVAAIQTKIDEEIMPKLEQATADIVEINNKLTEIEPWIEQNGEELAKLTANVTKINNLINTISQETAETISNPAILAAIKNLPSNTNESLTNLQNQIDALEQQLQGQGGETGEGEETSLLSRLEELEGWKQTITNDLIEGGEYGSFKQLCEDIVALQVALNGNPEDLENNPGLIAQYNELKAQMAKFDMIQSVVYLPKVDDKGNAKAYLLESSQLTVKNKAGKPQTVAQKIDDNTIQFRVSPASKAAEFVGDNPRYVLSFDGSLLHDNNNNGKAFDKVVVDGEAKLVDATAGIIQYKVKTNLEVNDVWAVCAVITSQDVKDAEGEVTTPADGTNLSTTYFMAKQSTVEIERIEVAIDGKINIADPNPLKMPYKNGDGSASSIDFSKRVKVRGYKAGSNTPDIEDMVAEYGVPSLTYELNTLIDQDTSNDNWFTINNGVLTIPTEGTNIMIGRNVTVTVKPNFNFELPATPTPNATAKVVITARTFDYEVNPGAPKKLTWTPDGNVVALTDAEISAFVLNTNLKPTDLNSLSAGRYSDYEWDELVFTTGEVIRAAFAANVAPIEVPAGKTIDDVVKNAKDKFYVYIPDKYYTDEEQQLKLDLTTVTSGVETDTETYTLKVNVSNVDFGVKEVKKNTNFWPANNIVEYTPTVHYWKDDIKTGTVDFVENEINFVKLLVANVNEINAAGGSLVVEVENKSELVYPNGKPNAGQYGSVVVDVNAGTITYNDLNADESNDFGKVVKLKMYVQYVTSSGEKKNFGEVKCEINPMDLSGTWHGPAQNQSVRNLAQPYSIAGNAEWLDFRGKKMWDGNGMKTWGTGYEEGYNPGAKDKSNNYINGFTKENALAIYGLTGPKFYILGNNNALLSDNDHIHLNETTGKVTFKKLDAAYQENVTMTIRIVANSKWGAIEGLTGDHMDVTFTIEKGASINPAN